MPIPTTRLPSGEAVPVLGQGTWRMAEDASRRVQEIAALRIGLDLGMTLIDTAEMYADGRAETLVGEAIVGRRDEVFLVSKVLPTHATRRGVQQACDRSLRRLQTSHLDLYLLHWPEDIPLEETVAGFERLRASGKIRYWGVSNVALGDLEALCRSPAGAACATDQVLYNLTRRGIEWDLLPWCARQGMPVMAYSPIEQGRLLDAAALRSVAKRHDATPAQVALAWVLRQANVVAIPKAASASHVRENHAALGIRLTSDDLAALDEAFPPPTAPQALESL